MSFLNFLSKTTKYQAGTDEVIYPHDLFSPGNEAYVLFIIRDSVVTSASIKKKIALYMPPEISVNYGAEWTNLNMSLYQYANSAESLYAFGKDGVNGSFDTKAAGTAVVRGGANAIDAVAGSSLGDEQEVISRQTLNPHAALMFKGVNFREFTLKFQLMARNKEESESIQKIIKNFKSAAHPGRTVEYSRYWTYPDDIDIFLATPENQMFNIATSVLTGISVDYAGSGVQSFFNDTGAPVEIGLTLTFKEKSVLTKERIEQGF